MSRWKCPFCLLVLWTYATTVDPYPSGAPTSTCDDMVPRHLQFVPQTSPSPYFVQPAVSKVTSGTRLKVVLSSTTDVAFVGFMVQARSPGRGGEIVGSFTDLPASAQAITCGPNAKSTATHQDRIPLKKLELEWEAPDEYEGPIIFNTTFVQNGATFWVGIQSEPVQVVKRSLPDDPGHAGGISTTKPPIRLTTVPNYTLKPDDSVEEKEDPIYKGCNTIKSCFGIPNDCIQTRSCIVLATTFVRGDTYEFELMAKNDSKGSPRYVALAFSDDQKMGGDSVTECVLEPSNKVNVYMSYNLDNEKNNVRLNNLNDKVKLKNFVYKDGSLYCKFIRDTVSIVKGKVYDLAKGEFYLLLASGTGLKDNGKRVGWHDIGYEVASSLRHLSDVGQIIGSSDLLYRLHGAFMVSAWVGCTSIGILLARYFKSTWVGKKFLGKDQWFIWHRAFMVTTWTLTVSAFVIIFVQIQDWYSETSNPHAILGCIATGLAFIQPFGAALRPTPDSPKRPIFNWLHWLVGNCAHILAIVTIFFAVKLNKAELPDWMDWILVTYVAFHVFMHLLFSVTGCFSEGQVEKRVNDFPMKDMGPGRGAVHGMDRKRDAPHAYLRKFFLAVYLTVIALLTVILVVIVVAAPIEEHWVFVEAKKLFARN